MEFQKRNQAHTRCVLVNITDLLRAYRIPPKDIGDAEESPLPFPQTAGQYGSTTVTFHFR